VKLRRLLMAMPRDWRSAARLLNLAVHTVSSLPGGAPFSLHQELRALCVVRNEDGDCTWSAWAGIGAFVALDGGIQVSLSELCAVASDLACASGLFLVSNIA
jgi:hypothetical protein